MADVLILIGVFFARGLFVYLLGIQTINVIAGRWVRAFWASIAIGICEFTALVFIFKAIAESTNSLPLIVVAILGGSTGIAIATYGKRPRGK